MTLQRVFDGQRLRIVLAAHGHRQAMVTFDFRTPGKQAFGPDNASRGFDRNGFDQIMVKTRANDWFINEETQAMEAALAALCAGYEAVRTLGYSMGGYRAFRFADAARANHVTAVSPQLTIDPAVPPFDTRYRAEAQTFDPVQGQIAGNARVTGHILFDPFRRFDAAQARLLQTRAPGIGLIAAPFGGHPATQSLRDAGHAGAVQRLAMGRIGPEQLRRLLRKSRRQSSRYWSALAAAAGTRRPRLSRYAADQAATLGQNDRKDPA